MPYDDYAAQRTASLLDRISKDKTIASTNKKASPIRKILDDYSKAEAVRNGGG